jgi:Alpha-L-arabinofuranosidase B (ABFB) domain/Matrixin/Putative peptidoglycan binding domain
MKQPRQSLRDTALVGPGGRAEGFAEVSGYLGRFGYLAKLPVDPTTLDEPASEALKKFQEREGLPATGAFDAPTRERMSKSRCGLPDLRDGVAFVARCAWNDRTLRYAFGAGTQDVAADEEFAAVRAAFRSWAAVVPISFTEVTAGDNPDVLVEWRDAADPDHDMTGPILAHADFPPGCGIVTNQLPKPVHFDDSEHTWIVGAAAGQYDIETVALHELGHILGLQHSSVPGAIMQPTVDDNATRRVLAADDIDGVRRLYPPQVSFRSANFTSHFIRHRDFIAQLTEVGTELDRTDATFRVVPGLADPLLVSLESVNFPDFYLRHENFELKLHRRSDDQLFREDATFHVTFGLSDPKGISLRSFNYRERFVRHRDFKVFLDEFDSSPLFRADATFFIVNGLRLG